VSTEEEIEFAIGRLTDRSNKEYREGLGATRDLLEEQTSRRQALQSDLLRVYANSLTAERSSFGGLFFRALAALSIIDQVKLELLSLGSYAHFASSFASWQKSDQLPAAKYLRLTLTKGWEIRDQILSQFPLFPEHLHTLLKEGALGKFELDVAGCLLILAGHLPDSPAVSFALNHVIGAVLQKGSQPGKQLGEDTEVLVGRALDCLMFACEVQESRRDLFKMGVMEMVRPFLNNPDSPEAFVACLIGSLLSASDDNQKADTLAPLWVSRVIECLQTFASKPIKNLPTTKRNNVLCSTVLVALRSMATNEANMAKIKEYKTEEVVLSLISNRKNDIFQDNEDALEQVSSSLPISFFFSKKKKKKKKKI